MKKYWKANNEPTLVRRPEREYDIQDEFPVIPASIPVSLPVPMPDIKAILPWTLKCLGCMGVSDVLFEGSSYCRNCLTEKLRVGK